MSHARCCRLTQVTWVCSHLQTGLSASVCSQFTSGRDRLETGCLPPGDLCSYCGIRLVGCVAWSVCWRPVGCCNYLQYFKVWHQKNFLHQWVHWLLFIYSFYSHLCLFTCLLIHWFPSCNLIKTRKTPPQCERAISQTVQRLIGQDDIRLK